MGKCYSKAGCAVPESSAQHLPTLLRQTEQEDQNGGGKKSAAARPDLVPLPYSMPDDFQPSNNEDPALTTPVKIQVLSSSAAGDFGQNGTVVFLHGAGGSAKEYNGMWTSGEIDLPSGFTIVFVQSPRGPWTGGSTTLDSPWLQPSKYWPARQETLTAQVNDDVKILKHVLYELQKEAGGYSKLWLSGRSQGACLSTLLAVAGVGPTVAGVFAIAASALPQLQDIPSDGTYTEPSQTKLSTLRLGFYSGDEDDQFTGVFPDDSNGTFPLLKATLANLGFFSGEQEDHFWLKAGASHNSIGPSGTTNGDAFKVLFAFIANQDPTKAGVDGVSAWQ